MRYRSTFTVLLSILFLCGTLTACSEPGPEDAKDELAKRQIGFNAKNFVAAIEEKNQQVVDLFLKAHMSLNVQTAEGKTPLMHAAGMHDSVMLTQLLAAKLPKPTNPNLKDLTGKTALHYAILSEHTENALALLPLKPDLSISDAQGDTPFHYLATKTTPELAVAFMQGLSLTQTSNGIDKKNMEAYTPLISAILQKKTDLATAIINAGANINIPDRGGMTPLMHAIAEGNTQISKLLLANTADLTIADTMGRTALIHAIKNQNNEIATQLLEQHSNNFGVSGDIILDWLLRYPPVNKEMFGKILQASSGINATHLGQMALSAFQSNSIDIVPLLVEAGADVNTKDDAGNTLLLLALQSGNEPTSMYLINAGANPLLTNLSGLTPAEIAVEKGLTTTVTYLIRDSKTANYRGRSGYTPAEIAVMLGYPEILQHLLEHGATINPDVALLWAIQEGGGRTVPILLKHGASARVLTQDRVPALWLATFLNQPVAVQSFVDAGAIPDIPNPKNMGTTPLMIAAQRGYCEVVQILINAGASPARKDQSGKSAYDHAEEAPNNCLAE